MSGAVFTFICGHYRGLECAMRGDQIFKLGGDEGASGVELTQKIGRLFKEFPAAHGSLLNTLTPAGNKLSRGQCGERFYVNDDSARLMKSAHQIFSGRKVHTRLTATDESICANKVVGIWIKGIPRK